MKSGMRNMMGLIGVALAMSDTTMGAMLLDDGTKGDNPLKPSDIDVTPAKVTIPKGQKKFVMRGEEIWALNYKNAKKKLERMQKECIAANHANQELMDVAAIHGGGKLCPFCDTRIK